MEIQFLIVPIFIVPILINTNCNFKCRNYAGCEEKEGKRGWCTGRGGQSRKG